MKIFKFFSPFLTFLPLGTNSLSTHKKSGLITANCYNHRRKFSTFKFCFLSAIIFQLFFIDSFAQNFFPLSISNKYQIKDSWWFAGPGNFYESGTNYYGWFVSGDTTIGGETFYLISGTGLFLPFPVSTILRYDQSNQKVFIRIPNDDTTRLAVDFNAPTDSSYISFITGTPREFESHGISNQIVFGDSFLVYSMRFPVGGGGLNRYNYNFSDKIGLYKFSYYWTNGWNTAGESIYTVISAIVDSVVYNPFILQIDSLYPVIDRPVDTFPFLLSIPYTASYTVFVDSFYLSAKQFRSDTLFQTKIFNISTSNPKISFYIEGLLPGDIINLRATITDTSIFNNIAHYPDTGWVVINVLPPILGVVNDYAPLSYELAQNYPNPFNPITTISYRIPERSMVTLKAYDVLGNSIAVLVDEEKAAGSYEVEFDASRLASGIYYYRIVTKNFTQTRKMILLK